MELPMVELPGCSLDAQALRAQLSRYAELGRHGTAIEQNRRLIVFEVAETTDPRLVEATVATENGCCPFLEVTWSGQTRRLTIAAGTPEHEPIITAIADALKSPALASSPGQGSIHP